VVFLKVFGDHPRVLMGLLSMSEHASGMRSLARVQYVFVELPRLVDHVPTTEEFARSRPLMMRFDAVSSRLGA
jgi:hypothetical protein